MPSNPTRLKKTEKVIDCPACGEEIEATARIRVEMLEPTITAEGDTSVETTSTLEYYHVTHRCPGNPSLSQVERDDDREPVAGPPVDDDSGEDETGEG